jgi:hypothetical protein
VTAIEMKEDAFAVLGTDSEFEAICLISDARHILSLGIPGYVREPILTWNDDLGIFSREDYRQAMEVFATQQHRERMH